MLETGTHPSLLTWIHYNVISQETKNCVIFFFLIGVLHTMHISDLLVVIDQSE